MPTPSKPTVIRFQLALPQPRDAFEIFYPKGHHVLNRTEWRGKEPRSCAVTGLRSKPKAGSDKGPTVFDVEVSYRPKGYITFVGETKYDGWTALMLNKKKDGTLLDMDGNPLPPGQPPIFLPFEVYEDAEFNEIDFGDFIEEIEVEGVAHITHEELMRRVAGSRHFSTTIRPAFCAPRRQRPEVRIIITDAPIGPAGQSSDMRTFLIDKTAPHFGQTLFDQLYEVASGFVEGRYGLKTLSTETVEFVEFADCLMEVKIVPGEQQLESLFDVFNSYVSSTDMEEIAKRLMAVYAVNVTVVDGKEPGFVLERTAIPR